MPVYNGEKYLKETIRMILNSDLRDLELIIVDDGSTDNSKKIIYNLQHDDSRLVYYHQSNRGVSSSRNYGVEKATGEYICFADQDDIIRPYIYDKLISIMSRDNSEIAMCSSARTVSGEVTIFDGLVDGKYTGDEILNYLLLPILFNGFQVPGIFEGAGHHPHIWTCMFQRKFWRDAGLKFRSYINYEGDLLVKIEALSKAHTVSTISDVGYLWRVNLSSETYSRRFIENIGKKQDDVYLDLYNSLLTYDLEPEVLSAFKQVTFCKQYADAVHNFISPDVKKKWRIIKQYYQENIYGRDFEQEIAGRRYIKRGRIKLGILLPLLAKHMTLASFLMEVILNKLMLFSLHSSRLSKIERSLKQ